MQTTESPPLAANQTGDELDRGNSVNGTLTDMPPQVSAAVDCLRVVSAGFLFFAYGGVVTQAFNGAGDTWTPTHFVETGVLV